ncbi:hypothetical protein V8P49_14045 [Acinetobacter baumannii]
MSFLNDENVSVAIEKAMHTTLGDIRRFVNDLTEGIQAEYLFTVNVAKELAKHNIGPGDPYKIRLERKVNVFARDCLPKIKIQGNRWEKNSRKFLKDIPKTYREGKIDLAVYVDGYLPYPTTYPLCAIELKAFNPAKCKIKDDLLRNQALLNLQANTGESVLKFTHFAAFHWYKTITIGDEKEHFYKLNEKYLKLINELPKLPNIKAHDPKIFMLSNSQGDIEMEADNTEVIDTSTKHHFSGVIITLSKNSH